MSSALVHLDFEVFAPLDVRNSPKLVPDLLSWACALLQSLPSFEPPRPRHTICTVSLRLRHPPLRFLPLQRFPARDSGLLICQVCLTQQPASSGFLDPPMLSSATYLLALFHARSTHGVAPSRASLLPHGRTPSPAPSTLMSFQSTPSTNPTNPCSTARQALLLHPHPPYELASRAPPTSRSCSMQESATQRRWFRPALARSSPGFCVLQGLLPLSKGPRLSPCLPS